MTKPPAKPAVGFLQREFDAFCLVCFLDLGPQQYIDLRRTFMAGAATLYGVLMRELGPGEEATDTDMALMDSLQKEISEFNEAVKRREK